MTEPALPNALVSDESPSTDARRVGPAFRTTHPLASGPIVQPPATVDGFVEAFLAELNYGQGVQLSTSTVNDQYLALARTVRRYLMADWLGTGARRRQAQQKTVGYLSAEYLLGRQLGNNLLATNLQDIAEVAMDKCGIDIATLRAQEVEPGLGNGGLGRLAACFVDSLATMDVPCIGYGIRYEYGIFRQTFEDERQVEVPDSWLSLGNPWEFPHPERQVRVAFGGHTETWTDAADRERTRWVPDWDVLGMPYHYMVPGFRNGVVNTLRLWSARATHAFDLQIFNAGDYAQAVRAQTFAENISKVLYPEDSTPQGKELRLQQQYFFVACSLHDFIENTLPADFDLHRLPQRIVWQLNDTHPVIAIPEMMRILVDVKGLDWDDAWSITQRCFAYTCHTLLPEALEVWPAELLGRLLPRHLEIIYRINDEFLEKVQQAFPGDEMRVRRMSIIAEHPERSVRMAYLATVTATKVNGVAELHSQLLRDQVLPDFSQLWPEKFTNVTNGVTPRRFVRLANRNMSELVTETIGEGWVTDLDRLRELEPYADDAVLPGRLPGGQGRQQGAAQRAAAGAGRPRAARRLDARRHGQAAARVQAADAEAAPHRRALRRHRVGAGGRRGRDTAHLRLRRQGGAGLPPGEGDHLPRQLGGHSRQRRPPGGRPALRRLPGELQRHPRREADPGRRPLRADLARRQGGLRDGEHEVRAQRRAHHRHRRRRQRRDPAARRRRQLLPLRDETSRRSSGCRRTATPRRSSTRRTPGCGAPSTCSRAATSPTATAGPWPRSSTTSSTRTRSWRWRTSAPTWTPRRGSRPRTRTPRRGRARPSSTSRGAGSSPPTGRCATTWTGSGGSEHPGAGGA